MHHFFEHLVFISQTCNPIPVCTGFLPARIWVRREEVQKEVAWEQVHNRRVRHWCSILWCILHQLLQTGVENSVRYSHSCDSHDISILQWLLGSAWGSLFLAIDRLLPHWDVYRPGQVAKVLLHVDVAQDIELGLFDCLDCGRCRFHSGTHPRSQDVQALQLWSVKSVLSSGFRASRYILFWFQ